ncbi:hypothetical protein D3C80_1209300 [compost metagenome]
MECNTFWEYTSTIWLNLDESACTVLLIEQVLCECLSNIVLVNDVVGLSRRSFVISCTPSDQWAKDWLVSHIDARTSQSSRCSAVTEYQSTSHLVTGTVDFLVQFCATNITNLIFEVVDLRLDACLHIIYVLAVH